MIRFRASTDQIDRWNEAAAKVGLELNDWIRATCDVGASSGAEKLAEMVVPAPKKSQEKIDEFAGDRSPNPFKARQDARKAWDRQYKRLPLEIRDSWAEENPRP